MLNLFQLFVVTLYDKLLIYTLFVRKGSKYTCLTLDVLKSYAKIYLIPHRYLYLSIFHLY